MTLLRLLRLFEEDKLHRTIVVFDGQTYIDHGAYYLVGNRCLRINKPQTIKCPSTLDN